MRQTRMRATSWIAAAAWVLSVPAVAEDWPQWRGPRFDGTSGAKGLPVTWSADENVRWRFELPGPAASTPIVWGERIFVTSTREGSDDLLVLAVGRDGKLLWQKKVDEGGLEVMEQFAHETSPASPSPVTDGEHVWALFATGKLVKLDFDGNLVWRVDLAERYGAPNMFFGLSMSPLLYEDRLFLQLLHADAQLVVALDKGTGDEVWRHERSTDARGECLHSYASPVPWEGRGGIEDRLLIHGADFITAHRMSDGVEVWRYGTLNPPESYNSMFRLVATPVVADDFVVVPTAKRGPVFALRPGGAEGPLSGAAGHVAWKLDSGTPDVPSPLVVDGLVYLAGERGTLTVLEADGGAEVYAERVHQSPHRGSPVLADGKVFLVGTDGTVSVVRSGRRFELLSKNSLGERLAASPAVGGDTLYLRTYKALYAIGDTTASSPSGG